jgi:hypothetical protein
MLLVMPRAVQAGSSYRMDGDALAGQPTVSASVAGDVAGLPDGAGFTDARFAQRLGVDGATVGLFVADVVALRLRSEPTAPGIGVADAAALAAPPSPGPSPLSSFWPTPHRPAAGSTRVLPSRRRSPGRSTPGCRPRWGRGGRTRRRRHSISTPRS